MAGIPSSSDNDRADLPSTKPAWVTPELLEKTRQLWSKKSGTAISSDEALGIIVRVGTLLDVLDPEKNHDQTIRRVGESLVGPPEEGRVQP